MKWDPDQYGRYASERNRPFFDLTARIDCTTPGTVVDLGCGPGDLTASLAERWPQARVLGLDSSPDMIERAQSQRSDGVSFRLLDADAFEARGVDVLISNALLQWVPGHQGLLTRWAGELNAGGWLAFQVPSNFGAPSHQLMREVAESPRWRAQLHGVLRHRDAVADPAEYLDLLATVGLAVDAWQTSYLHVLTGPDPVLEWVRGTGLRPVLAALSPEDAEEFETEYAARLRQAYPARSHGTVFRFTRTFVVAAKPA